MLAKTFHQEYNNHIIRQKRMNNMNSVREELKQQRRVDARKSFIQELNDVGGYFNLAEVSKYLNLSYDEINSLNSKRAILAFTLENEEIYPKFQFDDNKIIPKYSELLPLFNVSNLTATSFMMTGYIKRDGEDVPYYALMKNITDEEYKIVKHDAVFFGSSTSH